MQSTAETSPMLMAEALPVRTIEFGHAEFQTHIGGSFLGPENKDGISQNWAGAGRCWCILPNLSPTKDYIIRLEAAPFAPYGAELQDISLLNSDGSPIFHRIVPVTTGQVAQRVASNFRTSERGFEFRWRRLPPPTLTVSANNYLVGKLVFETRPDLQQFELLLRRDLVHQNTVLEFEPNFAITPASLESRADQRTVSFRFFRLRLYELT